MKKKAILQEKWIKEKWVKCTACHHYCQIQPDKTWICWIRLNEDGVLYLLTYWKALGVNIDPIEKKPLFHVIPWSWVFSFWTAGCNFSCAFCQNWTMSQVKADKSPTSSLNWKDWRIYIPEEKLEKIWQTILPEQIVSYCKENNINSIAYTYNEPTVFFEYAYDTMLLTRTKEQAEKINNSNKKNWTIDADILNIFVSNGYETDELWDKANWYLDAINIDLKGFSEEFYKKVLGWSLQPVLDNIKEVYEKRNIFLELTTLIIPQENDSEEELRKIVEFIKSISVDIPWHISAFHPDWKMLDKPRTPVETLEKAYNIAKQEWLRYVYIWNVNVPEYETTYCPKCWEKLVERSWFVGENIRTYWEEEWTCPCCNTKIPWIWRQKDWTYIVRKETLLSN